MSQFVLFHYKIVKIIQARKCFYYSFYQRRETIFFMLSNEQRQ